MSELLLHRTRRPGITFRHDGRIDISAHLARMLDLRRGDSINIALDSGECLIFVCHRAADTATTSHYARCYPTNKSGHNYRATSICLCRAILDHCDATASRVSFPVGTPIQNGTVTYVPIITHNPL